MMDLSKTDTNEGYNDFALVSGFYGPGAFGCWYFVTASFLIRFIFEPHEYTLVLNLSSDLAATMLYPMIVVGHFLIQVRSFPSEHRDYLVANLANAIREHRRVEGAVLPQLQTDSSNTISGHDSALTPDISSPHRRDLYPKVVAINAALRIVDIFSDICLILVLLATIRILQRTPEGTSRRPWTTFTMFGIGLSWSWVTKVALWIKAGGGKETSQFIWSMGVRWISMTETLFCITVLSGCLSFIFICFKGGVDKDHIRENMKRSAWWPLKALCLLPVWLLALGLPIGIGIGAVNLAKDVFPVRFFMPATGIAITDLDQAAALTGGIFTFLLSARQTWLARRRVYRPVTTAPTNTSSNEV